jgi:hypothetical protein
MKKLLIILLCLFLFVTLTYASTMVTPALADSLPGPVMMLLFGCGLIGLAGIKKGKSFKK